MSTPLIVGIRFSRSGKVYHFDSSRVPDVAVGDYVVVNTSRGQHIGEVVKVFPTPPPPPEEGWKDVERRATAADMTLWEYWKSRQDEALARCRERAKELGLHHIKFVAAEFNYDGSRLAFVFSVAEGEAKMDLKSLRQDMQALYPSAVIEMRLVGPRDVAKIFGGMGACGIETRCCTRFLTEFSPVSIKMAKEQGISLTPEEITGMCGRLRCCLLYEYQQYVEARQQLPKRNKRVVTPRGEGKVVDVYPLSELVVVQFDGEPKTTAIFHRSELQPWDELEALRRKAETPCNQENGGCTCGKGSES
uniref:Hypothetical conserved protein n=1 Tax=uncultured Chloroflexota bacterium TaxID=166587 RepID=H5SA43_9CHLR|nr:hypothetical conserved protein [uncultured Chloroflexota bacterium]